MDNDSFEETSMHLSCSSWSHEWWPHKEKWVQNEVNVNYLFDFVKIISENMSTRPVIQLLNISTFWRKSFNFRETLRQISFESFKDMRLHFTWLSWKNCTTGRRHIFSDSQLNVIVSNPKSVKNSWNSMKFHQETVDFVSMLSLTLLKLFYCSV